MDDEIESHEVDRGRWRDLEGLFDSRGGPKYCWCMVWPNMPASVSRGDNDARKEALRERIQQGDDIGILGYLKGEVVGWCSVAPRDTYRALGGPADAPGENVWSRDGFERRGLLGDWSSRLWSTPEKRGQRWLRPTLLTPIPQATGSWGSLTYLKRWVFGKWGQPALDGT